ncbi:MAG: translation initiation factor IF-3 [bacterium]|nr:translation initiation factor IF-3 [bacterium]
MNKRILVNYQIKAPQVRLIDETGKQLGIVSFEEAGRLAQERNLDLIQVTEKVDPPVCKLGDFGKYLYQEEKREKAAKKHVGGETKGIRLSYNISIHDLETRAKQAEKFLKRGDRVFIELRLRGREKAFQHLAREKINKFLEIINGLIPIKREGEIRKEPRGLTVSISKNSQTIKTVSSS